MVKMTGSQAIVKCLQEEGVKTIFGYPGGAVHNFDALMDPISKRPRPARAGGWCTPPTDSPRASGRPRRGPGDLRPGATNTVTGIATAYMDSIPLVVLLVPGDHALSETMPSRKRTSSASRAPARSTTTWSRTSKTWPASSRRPSISPLREAGPGAHRHTQGRLGDGRVQISRRRINPELPADLHGPSGSDREGREADRSSRSAPSSTPAAASSRRTPPKSSARRARSPFPWPIPSWASAAFPGNHPLSLGMLGMHGTYAANMAITIDLIIAVGARFDDRATGKVDDFAPQAKIIHIDIDPTSISKNIRVDVPDRRRLPTPQKMLEIIQTGGQGLSAPLEGRAAHREPGST